VIAADAEIVGDVFVFQQDNSSILWVESLRYETSIQNNPDKWPANCHDLNPVDFHYLVMLIV